MKNKKIWLFMGLVVGIVLFNHIFGWSSYIGDMENLKFMERMVQENLLLASGLYVVLTIIGCVALALPGITFAILAGLIFGPFLGTLLCSVATTIGAMVSFLAGRFFLKDSIKPVVMKNRYLKKWLFDESEKNEIFVLMITRLVPVFPYNLQNFAYGITDISFGKYSIYSMLFMIPGTAMYTIGTAGLANAENQFLYLGIAVALAVAVIGLGAFFKKKYIGTEGGAEKDETELVCQGSKKQ